MFEHLLGEQVQLLGDLRSVMTPDVTKAFARAARTGRRKAREEWRREGTCEKRDRATPHRRAGRLTHRSAAQAQKLGLRRKRVQGERSVELERLHAQLRAAGPPSTQLYVRISTDEPEPRDIVERLQPWAAGCALDVGTRADLPARMRAVVEASDKPVWASLRADQPLVTPLPAASAPASAEWRDQDKLRRAAWVTWTQNTLPRRSARSRSGRAAR